MNEDLRPSTLGEILDRTVSLYRSRFLVYLGIAAVPSAVVLGFGGLLVVLLAWSGMNSPDATVAAGLAAFALVLVAAPLAIGANALSDAALCHAASTFLMGDSLTVVAAYKSVWKRGWSYVGLYVLQVLVIAVAPVVLWGMVVGMMAAGALVAGQGGGNALLAVGIVEVVLFLGLLVYGTWMLLQLCLAFPASVVERVPVGEALRRAWNLSKGTKWRMLVLFILGVALTWLLSAVLIVLLVLAIDLVPGISSLKHSQAVMTASMVGMYTAAFGVQALTKPVYGIALVLFYYDQRVRQEAFDVEVLMRRAGMVQEAAPEEESKTPWLPAIVPAVTPASEQVVAAHAESRSEEAEGEAGDKV